MQEPSIEQHLDAETNARSLELAYRMLPVTLAMTAIAPLPLTLLFRDSTSAWMRLTWVLAHCAISAGRFVTYRRYFACPDRTARPERWSSAFTIGSAASGFAWSAIGTVFYPLEDQWSQTLIGFAVTGIATIGVINAGSRTTAFRAFVVSFLFPITAYRLWLGGSHETSLAVLTLGFAFLLIVISHRASGNALATLRMQAQSEQLSLRLAEAIAQAEARNAALKNEVVDREHAESQKRAADARLHLALESAGMHSWEYDMESREVLITGAAPSDTAAGRSEGERFARYAEHAHPEDRDALRAAVARARDVGDVFRAEFRIKPADQWRWMSARGRVVADNDGSLRMIGVSQDITRRREAQDELIKAKETAEAASRAKSQFLANMSHEIRTPLNGVVGMLELLTESNLTAAQSRMAQSASRSSEALLAVINNILDISKIEANRLELDALPFDAAQLVEDVTSLLADSAARKQITIACHVDPSTSTRVVGDPNRVRQVLINLVANAVKFTERGEVEVGLAQLHSSDGELVHLRFTVRDTGIGLSEEQLSRLFQPFVQADMSTSRRFGGTGLGLAICRQLAELMRGSLTVQSTPDVGSTFTFELALPRSAESPTAAPAQLLPNGHHMPRSTGAAAHADTSSPAQSPARYRAKILVVEDNEINRQVASAMLARLDCDVVMASNADEGVDAAAREPFDLILMDCQMPLVDGFEATRRIRAQESNDRRVPIVALTANALQGDRERCLAAGMDDYLTKPFSRASLDDAINRWLSPRAPEGAAIEANNSTGTGVSVLDLHALEDIAAMDATGELLRGLVTMYLKDGAELVSSIQSAQQRGDASALGFAAHKLKSSSGCVGAREVMATCAQIEAFVRTQHAACSDTSVHELHTAFAAAVNALTSYRATISTITDGVPA